MPTAGWLLVDSLEDHRITVIARDHEPKDRISFERAVTDKVGSRGSGKEATRWLESVVAAVRDSRCSIDDRCNLMNGQNAAVRAIPVLGPDRVVHAVQMWLGPVIEASLQPPVQAYGFTWDTAIRLAEVPTRPTAGAPLSSETLTAPDVFHRLDVQDGLSLVTAMLTTCPAATWQGAVTIAAPERRVPAHMIMTSGPTAEQARLWRGVVFETAPSRLGASLESAMMSAVPLVSQTHMALVDVAQMRLIRWLTDPLPEVQWKGSVDNRDTPHPDDVRRIFAAAAEVFTGQSTTGRVDNIRLRRIGGGWVVVDGRGAVVHTQDNGPVLAVVQFDVTGESDEPDPVSLDDQGLSGLE